MYRLVNSAFWRYSVRHSRYITSKHCITPLSHTFPTLIQLAQITWYSLSKWPKILDCFSKSFEDCPKTMQTFLTNLWIFSTTSLVYWEALCNHFIPSHVTSGTLCREKHRWKQYPLKYCQLSTATQSYWLFPGINYLLLTDI